MGLLDALQLVRNFLPPMCPHCRTSAPLIYRGVTAYCAACGRQRTALSADSLTYAGKPAQLGASVVRAFGWVGLMAGLLFAIVTGLLVGVIGTPVAGLITFAAFALFSALVFYLVRRGGRALDESGQESLERKQEQALYALAARNGGMVHAFQAAAALDLTVDQADAVLTRLNRARPLEIQVELSDDGQIFYAFAQQQERRRFAEPAERRVRFASHPGQTSEVASAARPIQSGAAPAIVDADFEPLQRTSRRS